MLMMESAKYPLKQSFSVLNVTTMTPSYQGLTQSGENVKITEPTQRNKHSDLRTGKGGKLETNKFSYRLLRIHVTNYNKLAFAPC